MDSIIRASLIAHRTDSTQLSYSKVERKQQIAFLSRYRCASPMAQHQVTFSFVCIQLHQRMRAVVAVMLVLPVCCNVQAGDFSPHVTANLIADVQAYFYAGCVYILHSSVPRRKFI
jgi:hypothetical protein